MNSRELLEREIKKLNVISLERQLNLQEVRTLDLLLKNLEACPAEEAEYIDTSGHSEEDIRDILKPSAVN